MTYLRKGFLPALIQGLTTGLVAATILWGSSCRPVGAVFVVEQEVVVAWVQP